MAPFHEDLPFDTMPVVTKVRQDLRAFIGQTTFEELARQWVYRQAEKGEFSFVPERIGSHWDNTVQVDVIAIDWHHHHILLGECKWSKKAVNRAVIDDLVDKKTPRVLKSLTADSQNWQVEYAFFARAGFTASAQKAAQKVGAHLVDLAALNETLTTVD